MFSSHNIFANQNMGVKVPREGEIGNHWAKKSCMNCAIVLLFYDIETVCGGG